MLTILPPPERVSFYHVQSLNREIYWLQNSRVYSPTQMCMKILRYATIATKGIRKGKAEDIRRGTVMAFSWSLALANHLSLDLDMEVRKRFPGVCPYCTTAPCACGNKRASVRGLETPAGNLPVPLSVAGLQFMFAGIYPQNTLVDSGAHLTEEGAELLEAYIDYVARHTNKLFEEVVLELVDVIANLFAVANTISELQGFPMSLMAEYLSVFGKGCPNCTLETCACGLTSTADSVVMTRGVVAPPK